MDEKQRNESIVKLSNLFGAHKAEWLGERLFDLFTTPNYFPLMTTSRPCVLVGGRGTGKTSVLRGLSYEGQYCIKNSDSSSIPNWQYFGLYYRVNTNRTSAFQGPELNETGWTRQFGHYMNLIMCIQVIRFLIWYQAETKIDSELDKETLKRIATTIHISEANNNLILLDYLEQALAEFEANINNIDLKPRTLISLQGAPVEVILEGLSHKEQFKGKLIFFLIDEYENLLDYQQRLVNTLIKHSGELYTFKIGVRELGWRVRSTLNPNEQLISPADYIKIDISQALSKPQFEKFAYKICQDRLSKLNIDAISDLPDIRDLLPDISAADEAISLGIVNKIDSIKRQLKEIDTDNTVDNISHLMLYLIDYWSRTQHIHIKDTFEDYKNNPVRWKTRFDNYHHALLFTIRNSGIRKYYCGWNTFVQISGFNIRYLLQLVEESLLAHLQENKSISEPISCALQTYAAQRVGRTNLTELEGLAVNGAKLTKLLLGLGRIFGVMAAYPEGRAPETNQFEIVTPIDSRGDSEEIDAILDASVMHLALLRWSGSKAADVSDTRAWEYMIHPIYAPFFNFSYRRKRKIQVSSHELLALINNPRRAIRSTLARVNLTEDQLPEQLRLFGLYYDN